MDTMASALWDLFENQKLKGLAKAMRQTLLKLEKAGHADARWANAMGELAQADRDFAEAAKFFKRALDESGRPEYELNLGNAQFYSGDLAGAKRTLQAFLARYPEDIHGLVNLANCHLRLGELSQAKSLCLKGLGKKGAAAGSALWNCLGQAAHLEGDDARAYECFDRAYAEAPDYVDALFNRANIAYRLGREEEALRDLELCVRKDENYEAALLNAAVIHLEREDAESGKACLARALRINPDSLDAHHLLGRMHMLTRDFRLARDAFREALKADAAHIPTLLAFARLHIQESENDQARSLLKQILARPGLGRDEEDAALALLLELHEYGLCSGHLQRVPEAGMDGPRRKMLVLSLWREGRTRLAISHLEKLMGQEGETAGTLALLGRMLASSGAEPLAELRLRRALELDPSCQAAAFELSRIFMDRGEGPRALSVLEALLEHNPDDPDCLYNLACCHARLGQPEAGLKMLEKSLRNGFRDLDKIAGDADLEAIRQFKEYQQLTGHGII
jgi:tetratricopeptide (TPR) repeat protein